MPTAQDSRARPTSLLFTEQRMNGFDQFLARNWFSTRKPSTFNNRIHRQRVGYKNKATHTKRDKMPGKNKTREQGPPGWCKNRSKLGPKKKGVRQPANAEMRWLWQYTAHIWRKGTAPCGCSEQRRMQIIHFNPPGSRGSSSGKEPLSQRREDLVGWARKATADCLFRLP